MTRVSVNPALLRWASERSRIPPEELQVKFPRLLEWESQTAQPTFKQLEDFAQATHAPIGYFFLEAPPVEAVPIPDFRTKKNKQIAAPSPNLLDTVYLCQHRQAWYRDFAQWMGERPRPFVGAASVKDDVVAIANRMRSQFGIDLDERKNLPTWTDALRRLSEQAEAEGILVMVSGVVASDNRRTLDPEEFRGFALVDDLAPLVFINGSDTKSAQMFTLAHELAHVWLGQSALSNNALQSTSENVAEEWCNQVAAELLVPLSALKPEFNARAPLATETDRLSRRFKVSTLVVLRRLFDAALVSRERYWTQHESELDRLTKTKTASGGNFYATLGARVGKRLARAVVVSTLEGRSSFSDAFHMLGFKKMSTFDALGKYLEVSF